MSNRIFETDGRIRIEEQIYQDAGRRRVLCCWQPGRTQLFDRDQDEAIMDFYDLSPVHPTYYRLLKWLEG